MTPIEPSQPSTSEPPAASGALDRGSRVKESLIADPAAQSSPISRATDMAGWLGTAFILGAYALLSADVLPAARTYQAMNLLGALGVGGVCWRQRAWQPLFLQVAWGVIALVALARS